MGSSTEKKKIQQEFDRKLENLFYKVDKKLERTSTKKKLLIVVTHLLFIQSFFLCTSLSSLSTFVAERVDNTEQLFQQDYPAYRKSINEGDFKAASYEMHKILTSYEAIGGLIGTSAILQAVRNGEVTTYDEKTKKVTVVHIPDSFKKELKSLAVHYGKQGYANYSYKINSYSPCASYDLLCHYAYNNFKINDQKNKQYVLDNIEKNINLINQT